MSPQQSIAHYRILSKLGEGGMGEVWRATDTKLNRDVAVKILPEALAQNPDRMARFTRESQLLASLNHPNIAAIYGVEDRALIMELVEGPTLAERIAQGAMPVDESLPILHQLIDALEYAHEKNIVHRDLKPANVKITPEGKVKVLDFGLAKAMTPDGPTGNPVSSPTLTMRSTVVGTLLGTAAYMAPEQARGHNVDKRADIWAFGVVVYEMVTGQRLFGGPTVSDTLAAVLTKEPRWEPIPTRLRHLLHLCLTRDPRQRLRDIGDARALIEETEQPPPQPVRHNAAPWIAAVVLLTIVAAVAIWIAWHAARPVDLPLTRLDIDLGPEAMTGLNLTVAISPDGRRLVFPARGPDGKQQLATRSLDQARVTLLPGTENGSDAFFSPDGQSIAFFAGTQLKRMSVQGGAPVTLCTAVSAPNGGSWGEDGNITASLGTVLPLSRIPDAGGPPQFLTKLRPGEVAHRWPQVLPGGRAVLFTASPSANGMENANIEVVSLQTGQSKILHRGGYYGRYLPSGHLVYVQHGMLFGVPFDIDTLAVHGKPVPLVEDVASNPLRGGGQFDSSSGPSGHGTFVYAAGKSAAQTYQVSWLDSSGKTEPLLTTPGVYAIPHVSPDGTKLAYFDTGDIYVYDMQRDTPSRITFTGSTQSQIWAPDSRHVVYALGMTIYWIRSDGAGEPQRLLEGPYTPVPWSLPADSTRLAYFERNPETGFDIWTLPLDLTDPDHPKPGKPEPFLRTQADEMVPKFSPDGRWMAYRSNESGTNEIYVRPFPNASGGKWQISKGGGQYAFWSANGREFFYDTPDNRIMVLDYAVDGASFVPGRLRAWSDKQHFSTGTSSIDLAPDGKRFVVFTLPEAASGEKSSVHVTMLLNFFDEVKRRIAPQ